MIAKVIKQATQLGDEPPISGDHFLANIFLLNRRCDLVAHKG